MIGGAPRSGKSILAQQFAAQQRIGWISTDVLKEVLKVNDDSGLQGQWNAEAEAITAAAVWFFPYLERFVWGINSLADDYLIEGVHFLPAQVNRLSAQYPIRTVFLGCSQMTIERFDQFPGRSRGYANLSEAMRRRIADDIPLWSEFIMQEARQLGYPYIDMRFDFLSRLSEAEAVLTADTN